jgi:hypothetical protein
MATVVDLQAEKLARDDHLTGPARCIACGHQWQAVTPAGEFDAFECPSCHLHKGVLVYGVMPESWWECGCGCCLFSVSGITGDIVCWQCGTAQMFPENS